MADIDDMEMAECPVCKRRCPRDFYPLCSCEVPVKGKGQEKKKGVRPKKSKKS